MAIKLHPRCWLFPVCTACLTLVPILAPEAHAEVTCIVAANKKVKGKTVPFLSTVKRPKKCKAGEVASPAGPAGEDGSLRVYGDGSAGALTVSSSGNPRLFTNVAADFNTQFTSISVPANTVLSVPSGTILRATGDVTIAGVISVLPAALGGAFYMNSGQFPGSLGGGPSVRIASSGIARRPAGMGEYGSNLSARIGGIGGLSAGESVYTVSSNLLLGGGGGGPGHISEPGGAGGGSLMIAARGNISVTSAGSILADGTFSPASASGNGGGGGGVVILAAGQVVSHQGSISAAGGDGRPAGAQAASGGGGGGGLIVLAAPTIVDVGSKNVSGGQGGSARNAGTITDTNRVGGGGGGGSAGDGGSGATAQTNGSSSAGGAGDPGVTYNLTADPASVLWENGGEQGFPR